MRQQPLTPCYAYGLPAMSILMQGYIKRYIRIYSAKVGNEGIRSNSGKAGRRGMEDLKVRNYMRDWLMSLKEETYACFLEGIDTGLRNIDFQYSENLTAFLTEAS